MSPLRLYLLFLLLLTTAVVVDEVEAKSIATALVPDVIGTTRSAVRQASAAIDKIPPKMRDLVRNVRKVTAKKLILRMKGAVTRSKSGGTSQYGKKSHLDQTSSAGSSRSVKTDSYSGGDERSDLLFSLGLTYGQGAPGFIMSIAAGFAYFFLKCLHAILKLAAGINGAGEYISDWMEGVKKDIFVYRRKHVLCNPSVWILLAVGCYISIFRGVVKVIDLFLKFFLALFIMMIFTWIFLAIQENNTTFILGAHSGTLLAQRATNAVTGTMNTGKQVMNVFIPVMNQRVYSSVQSGAVLYKYFMPEDAKLEALSCNPPSSSSGRRLTMVDNQGHTQIWDLKRHADAASKAVIPMTITMSLIDRFENMVFDFQMMILHNFIEVILTVTAIFMPKVLCLMEGGIACAIREFIDFLVTFQFEKFILILYAVSLGAINIKLPEIPIGCKANEFPTRIDANLCGGYVWQIEPIGAIFSDLKPSTVTGGDDTTEEAAAIMSDYTSGRGRRLQQQAGDGWVHCSRNPHDGSFTETMDSRVLHRSHKNGCPHVRDLVLHPSHERALQLHRLKVLDDCVNVCLDGLIHIVSCFDSATNHPLHVVGTCPGQNTTIIPMMNSTVVQWKLQHLFPTYKDLSKLNLTFAHQEEEEEPEPPVVEKRNLRQAGPSQVTREDLISRMKQTHTSFVADKLQCDLSRAGNTGYDAYINVLCALNGFSQSFNLQSLGPDLGTLNRLFDDRGSGMRRKLATNTPREVQAKSQLRASGEQFIQFAETLRKNVRLLRAASEVNDTSFTDRVHNLVTEDQLADNAYFGAVQQSMDAFRDLVNTIDDDAGPTERRRLQQQQQDEEPPQIELVGDCSFDQYLCPNQYQCVATEEMESCIPLEETEDTPLLQKFTQTIHDASTTTIDLKGYLSNETQCWCDYNTKPSTLPVNPVNLRDPTAPNVKYCFMMTRPYTYFSEPVAETGLRPLMSNVCNGTSLDTSNCYCHWYKPTLVSTSVYVSGFLKMYQVNHIINALLDVQTLVYFFLTGPHAPLWFVSAIWSAWMPVFCGERCAPWLVYMFDNMGYADLTMDRRFVCAFLHTGSLLYTAFMVFSIIALMVLFWPLILFFSQFVAPAFKRHRLLQEDGEP